MLTLKRKMNWSAGCLGWNSRDPSLLVPRNATVWSFNRIGLLNPWRKLGVDKELVVPAKGSDSTYRLSTQANVPSINEYKSCVAYIRMLTREDSVLHLFPHAHGSSVVRDRITTRTHNVYYGDQMIAKRLQCSLYFPLFWRKISLFTV